MENRKDYGPFLSWLAPYGKAAMTVFTFTGFATIDEDAQRFWSWFKVSWEFIDARPWLSWIFLLYGIIGLVVVRITEHRMRARKEDELKQKLVADATLSAYQKANSSGNQLLELWIEIEKNRKESKGEVFDTMLRRLEAQIDDLDGCLYDLPRSYQQPLRRLSREFWCFLKSPRENVNWLHGNQCSGIMKHELLQLQKAIDRISREATIS